MAALTLFWLHAPSGLGAQSRASLQVAARVLEAEPSRAALSRAGLWPDQAGSGEASALAVVTVSQDAGPPSANEAERPRVVVTITFVRN